MKTIENKVVDVPPINLRTMTITIKGISPLLNGFNRDRTVRVKTCNNCGNQEAYSADPETQYKSRLLLMESSTEENPKYGMPASGLRNAAISAIRHTPDFPLNMTGARGAFHVLGDSCGLVEIISEDGPVVDASRICIGQ